MTSRPTMEVFDLTHVLIKYLKLLSSVMHPVDCVTDVLGHDGGCDIRYFTSSVHNLRSGHLGNCFAYL